MTKYNVQITRLAVVWREEEIEAKNEQDAKRIALELAKDDGDHGWKFDGIFDDGKPHSEVSVDEITELDAEGFPVEDSTHDLDEA